MILYITSHNLSFHWVMYLRKHFPLQITKFWSEVLSYPTSLSHHHHHHHHHLHYQHMVNDLCMQLMSLLFDIFSWMSISFSDTDDISAKWLMTPPSSLSSPSSYDSISHRQSSSYRWRALTQWQLSCISQVTTEPLLIDPIPLCFPFSTHLLFSLYKLYLCFFLHNSASSISLPSPWCHKAQSVGLNTK